MESESKKQASRLKRELRKIKSNLEGIRKMARLPGAVVAIDSGKECLALREARKLGIATIAVIDTDADPDTVDVAIPANDDSIRAINLILNELADAVAIGKTMVGAREEPAQRPKRVRSRRAVARASEEKPESESAPSPAPVKTAESVESAEPASAENEKGQEQSGQSNKS
jgi:small subunit ribosomal protein S2